MLHAIYAAVTRWRRRHARPRRLARPVISIGNLALGGRAKTPMVEAVARLLMMAGERPAILSRGYGRARNLDCPVVVRDADGIRAGLDESGDEPLMLAERLDGTIVVVHADRARAGLVAEQLGATVHVLDDGFQHLQLARDLDIVMIDPEDARSGTMPLGRLREPVDALRHADAIIVVHDEASDGSAGQPELSGFGAEVFTAVRHVHAAPADLAHGPCFLVLGIAGFERASAAIRRAGWPVAGEARFKDHHRYTPADAARIAAGAAEAGAAYVLTSAKDVVRLREVWTSALPLQIVEVELSIDRADAFGSWLRASLHTARRSASAAERRRREDGSRRAS